MSNSTPSTDGPGKIGPSLFWKQILGFSLLVLSAFGLYLLLTRPSAKVDLPVYFTVPDWIMLNENGSPMGSSDLKGKVYLANFIFSRCPSVCPQMLIATKNLQAKLAGKAQLISFTVDPDYDTPPVLYKLARQYEAQTQHWNFLTSENKEAMFKLFRDGFKISVSDGRPPTDLFDIAHSEKIVLVDQSGQIRGYYGHDTTSLEKAIRDALLLTEQSP